MFTVTVTPFQLSTSETWTTAKFNQGFNPTIEVTGDLESLSNWNTVTATTKAFTVTDVVTYVMTATAHGMTTGQMATVTSTGTLPTGLSSTATYYARALTADTFSLHYTSAGAAANTARVPTSAAGSGTHTISYTVYAEGNPLIFNAGTSEWENGIVQAENLPEFIGATATQPGVRGAVPQPGPADAAKYLKADGTWDTPSADAISSLFLYTITN